MSCVKASKKYGQRNIEKLKINKLLFQINDRINIINITAEKYENKTSV